MPGRRSRGQCPPAASGSRDGCVDRYGCGPGCRPGVPSGTTGVRFPSRPCRAAPPGGCVVGVVERRKGERSRVVPSGFFDSVVFDSRGRTPTRGVFAGRVRRRASSSTVEPWTLNPPIRVRFPGGSCSSWRVVQRRGRPALTRSIGVRIPALQSCRCSSAAERLPCKQDDASPILATGLTNKHDSRASTVGASVRKTDLTGFGSPASLPALVL